MTNITTSTLNYFLLCKRTYFAFPVSLNSSDQNGTSPTSLFPAGLFLTHALFLSFVPIHSSLSWFYLFTSYAVTLSILTWLRRHEFDLFFARLRKEVRAWVIFTYSVKFYLCLKYIPFFLPCIGCLQFLSLESLSLFREERRNGAKRHFFFYVLSSDGLSAIIPCISLR